jgi:hypothetical protein
VGGIPLIETNETQVAAGKTSAATRLGLERNFPYMPTVIDRVELVTKSVFVLRQQKRSIFRNKLLCDSNPFRVGVRADEGGMRWRCPALG